MNTNHVKLIIMITVKDFKHTLKEIDEESTRQTR